MKKALIAAATALSIAAAPAMAQDRDDDLPSMYPMAAVDNDNRDEIETYDADRQRMYYGWPLEVRSYYWTLDENDRMMFWNMDSDADRVAYYNANRMTGDMTFVRTGMVQNAPIARANHDGTYPICESDADDHCMNAWAAGQRGPGVDRPLNYWPGQTTTMRDYGG
ncbi:hypothetical protein [Aurantiacibacter gangjinensis]|nr:hypothetical protein [Aurantiacibacter gangjinensis]APE28435.1 hypothetical protein BMF35_a1606 [Aurantiacibacter gangjinensis]